MIRETSAFSEELQAYVEQLISVYDAANKESFYHGLVLDMTALVLNDYVIFIVKYSKIC